MKNTSVLLLALVVACARSALYDAVLQQKSGSTSTMTSGVLYTATDDTSGACAYLTGSTIVLSNVNVTTIGGTSSEDSSSFYGLNAGVLAAKGGVVKMVNVSILTTGKGANGAFAYNGTLTMANSTIVCYGSLGHGVDSTYGGYIRIDNVDITTYGAHGAPLSNDRGGGTVIAYGGTMKASGQGSPGIYSTGTIETHGCSISATNTEAITIEGRNKAHLYDGTYISGVCQGVKIYCSTSGDATAGRSSLIIKDSTLELSSASSSVCLSDTKALIYVDGTNDEEAEITLENAQLISPFSTLLWAINGANVKFTAVSQSLTGNALASSTTTAALYLNTSTTLQGRSRGVSLTIDSTSTWNVTGQSWATALSTTGTIQLSKTSATITVSGTATIGGSLVLPSTFAEGTYSVITASSLSGTFGHVTITSDTSRTVTASYTSTAVVVTVTGTATGSETDDTDNLTISDTSSSTGGGSGGAPGGGSGGPPDMPSGDRSGFHPGGSVSGAGSTATETVSSTTATSATVTTSSDDDSSAALACASAAAVAAFVMSAL
eukprot:m51a1_g4563 hypothetical protein (549) ;mRNA; r:120883-122529